MKKEKCPLCSINDCSHLGQGFSRNYYLCPRCELVHVPVDDHVSIEREREEYDLHENDEDSQSYRSYLCAVADEIESAYEGTARILDFGACRDFVLTKLLRERGHQCTPYDPLYSLPLPEGETFDIIVLCEVIEHLRHLQKELSLINNFLEPNGLLFIRTQFYPSCDGVKSWWYANDVTHINFFNVTSLRYVAKFLDRELLSHDKKRSAYIGVK